MKTATRNILITGFEPFGGAEVNPSALIARRLDGRYLADDREGEYLGDDQPAAAMAAPDDLADGLGAWRISGMVLPCVFGEALDMLKAALRRQRPALVLCLGLAENRRAITPERIAINVDDARIPDNASRQPVDAAVVAGGPAAYWSTLPVKAIVSALTSRGIPAEISNSAGTYVCNHVFYGLMHALRRRPGVRGGFIHLPPLPEQSPEGEGLPLETMIEAVLIAARIALRVNEDEA